MAAALGVVGSSGAAEKQLVPPRPGERSIDSPIANEYEAAAAHLFGTTLSPPAMVNACAHRYPEFSKENSAALAAWERRHAEALALIRGAAREMLLKRSGGDVSVVESTLQRHAMDAQAGAQDLLEREQPAIARKTCQTVPVALTLGPFALDTNPEFAVLRTAGEQRAPR
jgi:hypothetical protein